MDQRYKWFDTYICTKLYAHILQRGGLFESESLTEELRKIYINMYTKLHAHILQQGGLFESELQLSTVSSEELRKLFGLQEETLSDTFDSLGLEGPLRSVPAHHVSNHLFH
jgi:hypothetical protein